MSIELTTLCLSIQDLSQSEKHLLTILSFRSNQNYEVYSEIERLSSDCSCSIKTIERTLKKLRDKGYLIYTGKLAPKSKSIPIYHINLTNGQNGCALNLRTDNLDSTDGQFGNLRTDKMGIRIDNRSKDNKKDNDFSIPTQEQKNEIASDLMSGQSIRKELQWVYTWLLDNEPKKLAAIMKK